MGKCTFNPSWLLKDDGTGNKVSRWVRKEDENSIFCIVCECVVNVNKGFQAITQHAVTKKHKEQCDLKLDPLQLRLSNAPEENLQAIQLYSIKDTAIRAELIWTLKAVVSNYSAASCLDITETFTAMFPNSIPEGFCLNPKKVQYLISDALAPYFREKLVEDMRGAYYTLMYDETTNASSKKELEIIVRYWSKSKNKVVSHHLETFFIGSATAEVIFNKILEVMDKMKLPLRYLLMLGSDGPNVNKKVHKLMNEELKTVCERSLVDIGTCNIHIVHNAYLKGLCELGEDACELIIGIYYFFNGWPSRWETFSDIQEREGIPQNRFMKHCSTRWLTVENAAKRLIEQWPAIKTYFLKHIPSKTSEAGVKYKTILTLLKKPTIKAELHFLISSAHVFTKFTETFQTDKPLVHVLHSELTSLLQTLLGRFCKQQTIDKKYTTMESLLQESNRLPLKEMSCSEAVMNELSHVTEKEKMYFLNSVQKHFESACKVIMKKTSLSSDLLRQLHCLHPAERKTARSCRDIISVSKSLQVDVPDDTLQDEWKSLQVESVKVPDNEKIDVYWGKLLTIKNSIGEVKYDNVAKVVKAALVLSHGNSEVERGFSTSGNVLTIARASMSERTLNSIMTVKSALREYDNKPRLVPITTELLVYARNARKGYENYLQLQKDLQKQKERKDKEEEERKEKEKANEEQLLKKKESIKKCEQSLEEKRQKEKTARNTADSLFKEATERLKKGIEKNDIKEVRLAQAMLDGVTNIRKEEEEERNKREKLQKTLEKRKSSLIENFFGKKPKN